MLNTVVRRKKKALLIKSTSTFHTIRHFINAYTYCKISRNKRKVLNSNLSIGCSKSFESNGIAEVQLHTPFLCHTIEPK